MRIQILFLLLYVQSLVACQQTQDQEISTNKDSSYVPSFNVSIDPKTMPIIYQSTDGGQTWKDLSAGLPRDKPVESFAVEQGQLFMAFPGGLYQSQVGANAPRWERDFLLQERIVSFSPGQSGAYALSGENKFFHNVAKNAWVPVFSGLNNQHMRSIMETQAGMLLVGCDNGMFKSADQGKTWKQVFHDGIILNIVESNGVILAGGQQGILRSTDGGETWNWVLSEGGVGISTECIKGGFAAITYNTTSKSRRVRTSLDGGKTWQAIDKGLPADDQIASIKQVGNYFICGHPKGIFRSSDQGKTWQLVLKPVGQKVYNLAVSGDIIYAVPMSGGC